MTGGLIFAQLTAGNAFTCGLTAAGAAYCWGANSVGQLGNGTATVSSPEPVAVTGGLAFAILTAGFDHACGTTLNSVTYCWGSNVAGQLGDSSTTSHTAPFPAAGVFAPLAAGYQHTCGLTATGAAECWGANFAGQLGDSSTTNRAFPLNVRGGFAFNTLSAGGVEDCEGACDQDRTCGITVAGSAVCWGSNDFGELGDGSTARRLTPTQVSGGYTFAGVAAGYEHTCGLGGDGVARCWGANIAGQIGDGSTTQRPTPTVVEGGVQFARLSAGGFHTCGVTAGGAAYCWGDNGSGQLGDGSTTSRPVPVVVVTP